MQETIKVIKDTLNKNANELYELGQQKESTIKLLVEIQIEIYKKEERNAQFIMMTKNKEDKLPKDLYILKEPIKDESGEPIYPIGYMCDFPNCRNSAIKYDYNGVPMWLCDEHKLVWKL